MTNVQPDIRAIFCAALDRQSPAEVAQFLDVACGGDAEIRAQVEALLDSHRQAGKFLGGTGSDEPVTTDQPAAERVGSQIGRYKLLEQVGEGGMGIVYVAEQTEPVRRRVALKIIKPGMDTRQVIARFEAERQALAMMDHPNIAKILDAGTTGEGGMRNAECEVRNEEASASTPHSEFRTPHLSASRPYFVMELVRGMPITDYCDKAKLSPRQRLELFVDVCQAVQHAHQKGIIHRDLKPSNVMVTMQDGRPVVKVIDFGVAKAVGQQLTERTVYTALTQLVGTPLYMSPEQAELTSHDVDTRSDVYSLGVVLYELLTGQTPFDKETLAKAGIDEIRRIIREDEPLRPSRRLSTLGAEALSTASQQRGLDERRLSKILCGELDWIVMKALEKDRSRRYESASALAADIQRYLSDEPVLACPPTAMYRFQKFARKHKPALATAAAIAACLILGTTVSAWQAARATTAEAQATANEKKAVANEKKAVASEQKAVANEQKANANAIAAEQKEQEAIKQRDEVKALADKLAAKEQQLQRNLYASNMNLARHAWEEGGIKRVAELLAQHTPKPGETDLRGFEWHYLNRLCHSELLTLKGHTQSVIGVAYSPDGKRLASASKDKTVRVWDAQTGQELLALKGHTFGVVSVVFSPDGRRLASLSADGTARVWDAQTGKELLSFKTDDYGGNSVAFSPDGKRFASGCHEKKDGKSEHSVKVWDAQNGQELLSIKGHTDYVLSVSFSPDGKRLASASEDNTVKLWDAETGQELLSLKGHRRMLNSVVFSPGGKQLAGASAETLIVWDAQSGEVLHNLKHSGASSVAFSPDGQRLVADADAGTLRIWDLNTGKEIRTIKGGVVGWQVAFSPDGRRVASAASDNTVKVWDAQQDQENFALQGAGGRCVAFSPDFRCLASASKSTISIWDAQTGQQTLSLKEHTFPILSVAFSPDGKRLAGGGGGRILPDGTLSWRAGDRGEVKVWDAETAQELLGFFVPETLGPAYCVAFSPDGKRLASTHTQSVKVWDAQTGKELLSIASNSSPVRTVAFSPDGKRLTSESGVWDAQTGQKLLTLNGHTRGVNSVAYSTDGKLLATTSWDTGRVWDAHTGEELVVLSGGGGKLAFSPDSKRLVRDSKVWDAETGQELMSLKGASQAVAFSPDGHRLASNAGGTVKIYDATPLPEKP